jgi:bifunctional DNase/RNase
MTVEMKISGLMIDPVSNMPIIVLKTASGESVLPIWVGIFEANAIAMEMEKIVSPRPMTHDLLKNVIEGLNATIQRVEITDLRDNTFYAVIRLESDGASLEIDSRPSDAMALALRAGASIHVHESVIDKSSASGKEGENVETERLRRWLETVDPSELGNYEM